MEFCKAFNAKTQELEPGAPLPDRDHLLRGQVVHVRGEDAAGILFPEEGGQASVRCQAAGREIVGSVTVAQLKEIAEAKMKDLNANDVDQGDEDHPGLCPKSMGIEVKG